jgi:hypothetical protein
MQNHVRAMAKTIDQSPSLKSFGLADILSLSTGLLLPGSGARQVHALVAWLTGTDPAQAASQSKDAKECLDAQLPFLKHIDTTLLRGAPYGGRLDDRLQMWLEMQEKLFGPEHYLMPRERWLRRRNSHKL